MLLHKSSPDCHGGFPGGPGGCLVRGHVGLESTLCDIGYCTVLLAGCWGVGVARTSTHVQKHARTRVTPLTGTVLDTSTLVP